MKETHFLPFFCDCRHPTNCQGRGAKICGVSGSGDESLASKRGTKCTQKRPCPEMHGFCNFAVFVDEKSRALEPWAVQNIQKGKKVVECNRANRNVQKDVEQQKYGNHPLPAVIVARGCLCLGTEIANSPCSWCTGNMSPPRLPPGDRRHLLPGHLPHGRTVAGEATSEPTQF